MFRCCSAQSFCWVESWAFAISIPTIRAGVSCILLGFSVVAAISLRGVHCDHWSEDVAETDEAGGLNERYIDLGERGSTTHLYTAISITSTQFPDRSRLAESH